MDLQLDNRLALVTGSTAGIGYAIAEALAAEGARVIVNGRAQAGVDDAVAAIRKATGKQALGFAGDLSTAAAAEAVVNAHPGIGILVNNLGIFEAVPFEEIPDADWRRFFEVNVLSGARPVAGTGITVNSVLPGPTKSRGVVDFVESLAKDRGISAAQFEQEFFAHVRPTSLLKRFATTQEVAAMVAYVASPLASATTGAALRVDGGTVKSAF